MQFKFYFNWQPKVGLKLHFKCCSFERYYLVPSFAREREQLTPGHRTYEALESWWQPIRGRYRE